MLQWGTVHLNPCNQKYSKGSHFNNHFLFSLSFQGCYWSVGVARGDPILSRKFCNFMVICFICSNISALVLNIWVLLAEKDSKKYFCSWPHSQKFPHNRWTCQKNRQMALCWLDGCLRCLWLCIPLALQLNLDFFHTMWRAWENDLYRPLKYFLIRWSLLPTFLMRFGNFRLGTLLQWQFLL